MLRHGSVYQSPEIGVPARDWISPGLTKLYRVIVDSSVSHAMHVHINDGKIMTFYEISNSLYLHDTNTFDSHNTIEYITEYTLLNTVARNKASYTTCEVIGVDKAIVFNNKIGYLRPQGYIHLLQNNYFRNFPITAEDAKRAIKIYGHDTTYFQGKTKRRTTLVVPILVHTPLT